MKRSTIESEENVKALIKQDEKSYRCTGGSHVYNLDDSTMVRDKFGNAYIKKPEGF